MTDARRPSTVLALAFAAALAVSAGAPGTAGAADAELRSRQLFAQAEDLGNQGKWSEACPLYQAAHDLNSTGGTALHAADCYEKTAKYDRALAMYQYIVDHRDTDKVPERVALAERRVDALRKQLGLDTPQVVQGPTLPPPPPPKPPPPNRVPAFVAFGVGGAGLVLGAVMGGLALGQAGGVKADAATMCPSHPTSCTSPDLDARKSSVTTKAWVSNVGFGLAVAGAATGAVLWVLGLPKASRAAQAAAGPEGITLRF